MKFNRRSKSDSTSKKLILMQQVLLSTAFDVSEHITPGPLSLTSSWRIPSHLKEQIFFATIFRFLGYYLQNAPKQSVKSIIWR